MERDIRISWEAIVDEAKKRRKSIGFTQRRLAMYAGVSTPTLNRFEQARQDIQLSSALAILRSLGMAQGTASSDKL